MRNAMVVLVGMLVVLGLVIRPGPSEAVVNSCSVSGNYNLSGFALGNTEVFGLLAFTPNGDCMAGTFTGSVTIKVDASAAVNFPLCTSLIPPPPVPAGCIS